MNPLSTGRHLAYPFRLGQDGRTVAPPSDDSHLRGEILQLLLTGLGERPFLPDFGGGVRQLVFEPTSDVLRGVVKARLTQAINRYLGHRLVLEDVKTVFEGETITVDIQYRPAGTTDSRTLRFQRHGR